MMSEKDKQGALLLVGVAAVLLCLLGAKAVFDRKPKADKDNCLDPVTAETVLLLDETEPFSAQTADEIKARALSWIRDRVGVNERVTVFTVTDLSSGSLQPVFSRCRPPENGNRLVENVRRLRKVFDDNFMRPLEERLSVRPGNSRTSPIAQAITDISLSHYLRAPRNSLIVFSDMLENTSSFSMYRCPADPIRAFREGRRGGVERPKFRNTEIAINVVPRLGQSRETLRCRDHLWPWFFGDSEGTGAGVQFDPLPGGTIASKERP